MPVVHALADEFQGQARFVRVDADSEGLLQEAFDSSVFPTYLVFKDGVEVDRLTFSFTAILLEERLRGMIAGALE